MISSHGFGLYIVPLSVRKFHLLSTLATSNFLYSHQTLSSMKHFISTMLVLFLLLLSPNRSKGIRLLMEEQLLNSKHYHLHEDSLRSHDMTKEKKSGALIDSKQGEVQYVYSTLPPPLETKPPTTTTTMQKYPDILDIAGMDYTPAKRKPPIHN